MLRRLCDARSVDKVRTRACNQLQNSSAAVACRLIRLPAAHAQVAVGRWALYVHRDENFKHANDDSATSAGLYAGPAICVAVQ